MGQKNTGARRVDHVHEVKASVKAELDRSSTEKPNEKHGRLKAALAGIKNIEDDTSPAASLRRVIYVISAMIQHLRDGGLSRQQVSMLVDLGTGSLRAQGIDPDTSRLAFLYGEMHHVYSQIMRKEGRHWLASWEQFLSNRLVVNTNAANPSAADFAIANRAFRLGNGKIANHHYAISETISSSPATRASSRLARLTILRLSGADSNQISAFAHDSKSFMTDERLQTELDWEAICANLQTTGDMSEMLSATRKTERHYLASYLIEASMWAMSVPQSIWLDRVPALPALRRRKGIEIPDTVEPFLKFAIVIQGCYDYQIPFHIRLSELGKQLATVDDLYNIEKELLVWLSAARWLARSRVYEFASLALAEYESLSLRISDAKSRNALLIGQDLVDSQWYSTYATAKQLLPTNVDQAS